MHFGSLSLQPEGSVPLVLEACHQTLERVILGSARRTVNGKLVYPPQAAHKYKTCLSLKKTAVPEQILSLKPGHPIQVACLCRLSYRTDQIESSCSKLPVSGSILVQENKKRLGIKRQEGYHLTLERKPKVFAHISYRPLLWMAFHSLSTENEEWGKEMGWKMYLEEI